MRPTNKDRDAALATGDKHFEGNPCNTCGGTLRYTRNYTCVACMGKTNAARKEATKKPEPQVISANLWEGRANKTRFYWGKPCHRHPTAYRYVANGHCVECKKAMDRGEDLIGHNFATFEGKKCGLGHTTRYMSTGKCVECHRAENKERAELYAGPSYSAQKRKEEREMKRRLAMIRAERTARQKACAYGVRV